MNQPTDYASLIRASKQNTQSVPPYLDVGKTIRSPQYGTGTVIGWLGNTLIVKFPGYSVPVQFRDWRQSLISGEFVPNETVTSDAQVAHAPNAPSFPTSEINFERLQEIAQPDFRAIATSLASVLTDITLIPPSSGQLYPLPEDLPSALKNALAHVGISSLYGHQLDALKQLRQGKDLAIATPTASGKTLCYNLAILESCLNSPDDCALYIFPLKALAYDQLRKLQAIVTALPPQASLKVAQMTGDTPYEERKQLFFPDPPRLLAVSPDLLHYQLEKITRGGEWQQWREFLRRLRWVVIDEAHTYIGAFGAHFANLMRRLKRGIDSVGGNSAQLQFIITSATIGNPVELSLRFSGRTEQPERLHLIDTNQGTAAAKTILSLHPTSSPNPDTSKIVLSLLQHGLSGLVFCNARASVKNLLKLIQREANRQNLSSLARQVAPFYGSLSGEHRRRLIQQLETGEIRVILSTSALEAGLDLPELDCCIIRGYPGSLMSFRQRIGRVGRKHPGLVIFLPIAEDPLDSYYGKYPQQLLTGAVESAAFNPNYPTILGQHLHCCCVESGIPFAEVEQRFGKTSDKIAEELLKQKKLFLSSNSCLRASGTPHRDVNLRGNKRERIELINLATGESFEEISDELAYREVFSGAIYTASDSDGHLTTYRCEELNLVTRKASLKPLEPDTDLSTLADTDFEVKTEALLEEPKLIPTPFSEGRLRLRLHWGEITSSITGYKLFSHEYRLTCTNQRCYAYRLPLEGKHCPKCHHSLRYAEITQIKQEVSFPTPYQIKYQAPIVKLEINLGVVAAIKTETDRLRSEIIKQYNQDIPEPLKPLWTSAADWLALHSAGHQLMFALPLVVLSGRHDVNCLVEKENQRIVCYFFDTCSGGNGAAEAIFQNLLQLASKALALVEACDCEAGCPKCLTQHGCPQHNQGLNKALGLFLLRAIGDDGSKSCAS